MGISNMNLLKMIRSFGKREDGASLVEYGIALIVVVTVGVAAMNGLGGGTKAKVSSACAVVSTTCS
jgi:Flp pilus assembly pilin Flp